jgi:hypothetical protein
MSKREKRKRELVNSANSYFDHAGALPEHLYQKEIEGIRNQISDPQIQAIMIAAIESRREKICEN